MTPFTTLVTTLAVLDRANIDTDQIIPARFLRHPRSTGHDAFLFHDLPDLRAAVQGHGVLLAGDNFGCGSSRESAVYALVDAGIRCILAPSFADIFTANAAKNGLLLIPGLDTAALRTRPGRPITVDLAAQSITADNLELHFPIDPFRKRMLVEGLDDIALTLASTDALTTWSKADTQIRPWVRPSILPEREKPGVDSSPRTPP